MVVKPDKIILSAAQELTLSQIVQHFAVRKWPVYAGFGIGANIWAECSFRPNLTGDGGRAYGICQWHGDRQAKFKEEFGKTIKGATLQEQLAFVWWELTKSTPYNSKERMCGRILSICKSAYEAGSAFSILYERPKLKDAEAQARGMLAQSWFEKYGDRFK